MKTGDVGDRGLAPVVRTEIFSEHGAVVVDGDLDMDTAPQLESAIARAIGDRHRHFVIDLSAATFLDSMAIQALLMALVPLQADRDAAVVLAGAHGIVRRTLAVSGIDQMFTLFETRQAAVDGLEATAEPLVDAWRRVRQRLGPEAPRLPTASRSLGNGQL